MNGTILHAKKINIRYHEPRKRTYNDGTTWRRPERWQNGSPSEEKADAGHGEAERLAESIRKMAEMRREEAERAEQEAEKRRGKWAEREREKEERKRQQDLEEYIRKMARRREEEEERRREEALADSIRKMAAMREEEERHAREETDRKRKEAAERERQRKAEEERRERVRREAEMREAQARARERDRARAREDAARRERNRHMKDDKAKWGLGIWTHARALERFKLKCVDFDSTKFSEDHPLVFEAIPWPVLVSPLKLVVGDVSWAAVEEFFGYAEEELGASEYQTFVEKSHRRFHPDRWRARFNTVADEVAKGEWEEAVKAVAQALTPLWRRSKGQ